MWQCNEFAPLPFPSPSSEQKKKKMKKKEEEAPQRGKESFPSLCFDCKECEIIRGNARAGQVWLVTAIL